MSKRSVANYGDVFGCADGFCDVQPTAAELASTRNNFISTCVEVNKGALNSRKKLNGLCAERYDNLTANIKIKNIQQAQFEDNAAKSGLYDNGKDPDLIYYIAGLILIAIIFKMLL